MIPKQRIDFFVLPILFGLFFSGLSAAKGISFEYWPYELEGCKNIRDIFLEKVSEYYVGYLKIDSKKCNVMTGKWRDYFTDEFIFNAEDVVVASIIPIGHILEVAPDLPFKKLSSYVSDKDLFVLFKKGGLGEQKYLENKAGLLSLPKNPINKCEMLGRWIDAKIQWDIPFLENEKSRLTQAAISCLHSIDYDRITIFGQWGRPYGKCSTRTEVLRRDSLVETVPMSGYEDVQCSSKLIGEWFDPYTGKTFKKATKLDIDHVVPLKHVYMQGGWKWTRHKRKKFVNYVVDPFHLIPIDLKENRAKRNLGPDEYMPPRKDYFCRYLNIWASIKLRWRLSIDDQEKLFLVENIKNCPGTATFKKKFVNVVRMLASIEK